uniref:Uncharacterized protein n=1 Tax=Rhizophagus irregularis (strain DAOM 181602 / DAOM 197198 / MUCL 43194) TaxID=747089 RepID=U9UAN2_RHIID
MHFVLNNDLCHEFSIYPMQNIFWKFRELNIYNATVPDRMHHCDLGLFNYLPEIILNYIVDKKALMNLTDGWQKYHAFLNLNLLKMDLVILHTSLHQNFEA